MNGIATTAVSLVVLGSIAGGKLTTNSNIHLNAQPKPATVTVASSEAATPSQPATPAPVMVTVQAGDTLSSIADANSTTYPRIFDANDVLSDPNVIDPGQQLRIPTADEQLPDRMAAVTAPAPVPVAAPAQPAAASATPTHTVRSAASYPAVSGNSAKAFIYSHESGNNPNATNPHGCYGLGQDCNGRVHAQCGADYACQDAYFSNYAVSRYGSWDAAAAFWQTHGWW